MGKNDFAHQVSTGGGMWLVSIYSGQCAHGGSNLFCLPYCNLRICKGTNGKVILITYTILHLFQFLGIQQSFYYLALYKTDVKERKMKMELLYAVYLFASLEEQREIEDVQRL